MVDGKRIATSLRGYVVGTQGCSCGDYGHKSPTRRAESYGPGETVDDVASVTGLWNARWRGRTSGN